MVAMSTKQTLVHWVELVRKHRLAIGIPINFVFCLIVGLIVASFGYNLWISLGVSYCFGISIMTFQYLGHRFLYRYMNTTVISVLCLAIACVVAEMVAGSIFFRYSFIWDAGFNESFIFGFGFGLVALTAIYTLGSFAHTARRLDTAEANLLKQEKLVALAELKALQAQVEPHFLFNTLANIHSLIESEPTRASDLLEKLSNFLRTTLFYSRTTEATLGAELKFVEDYLVVQEARIPDRLCYELYFDKSLDSFKVPPLLVQPLVENAVIHGVEPDPTGGIVVVRTERDETGLKISVSDDGLGYNPMDNGDQGSGLRNLKERIYAWYGDAATLTIWSDPQKGTRAEITLPSQ